MHAIRMHDVGGPDVLRYEEAPEPNLQPGYAMVELQAVGVNFTDVYTRSGLVRPPEFPLQSPANPGFRKLLPPG